MRIRKPSAYFLVALISSGAASAGYARDLFVADKAYELHERTVEDKAVSQLAYKIRLNYPKQAVGNERSAKLKESNWIECSQSPNWDNFLDKSVTPWRVIHQAQRAFLNKDELVVIGMLYYSRALDGKLDFPQPDNNEQNVVVMKYNLKNKSVRQQIGPLFPQCAHKD